MKKKKSNETKQYDPYGRGHATIPFKVKVKPQSIMVDYIALHGLVPQNELPISLRYKIPENEIWIRKDMYDTPKRRERILQGHEKLELGLMETKGLTYKQAHKKAQLHEKLYKVEEELEKIEKELKIKPRKPIKVVERKKSSVNQNVKKTFKKNK